MSIHTIKELEITDTPLLLFECVLTNGTIDRWCTHHVFVNGDEYKARVLSHNSFDLRAGSDEGIDGASRVSLTLSNPDSYFSQIERNIGFKGSRLTVRFIFFNLKNGISTTNPTVLFQGIANPPDECTESRFKISFANRLNLQRVLLPHIRIQRRCPWNFPATAEQRLEAVHGGENGRYSSFYRCGYSPDQVDGVGNLEGSQPFTTCDFTRSQCEQRGMFSYDHSDRYTARFGGIGFVPASTLVRTHKASSNHVSHAVENTARYNDFVPMVYGTAWYQPPIVFAKNDGNLTRMEVLLGIGPVEGILKILVNGVEIPAGQHGMNMTATGWYNIVNYGERSGGFNADFSDQQGQPLGDPYGSMAYVSLVVPNRINDGRSLPKVEVLLRGLKVPVYSSSGIWLGDSYSSNPAWIILDILRRTGWMPEELNIGSFHRTAAYCEEIIETKDLNGNPTAIPRYECNLELRRRISAADLLKGIKAGAPMILTYGAGGLLELRIEGSIAIQHPAKDAGSNSAGPVSGGWPVYEFSDGSSEFGGILRRQDGVSSVIAFSKSTADTPNRMVLEFQDSFNEYQQDSVSLVNSEDVHLTGHELTTTLPALGVGNFDQALRIARLALNKSIHGNIFVELETSMKGLGIRPGDLVSLTYLKEGFERQLFRVLRISPQTNYQTALITGQIHEEWWYSATGQDHGGRRRRGRAEVGIPRPLTGVILDENEIPQFKITETSSAETDGGASVDLTVEFTAPGNVSLSQTGIPSVSFAPSILPGSGTMEGSQSLYYAVSASDSDGAESELSFAIRAVIPDGPSTFSVNLQNLSFDEKAETFSVYRGVTPQQLERISHENTIATQFTDTGLNPEFWIPADPSYDHANFYWRLEVLPLVTASIATPETIGNSTLSMMVNEHQGSVVRIVEGPGKGQERKIIQNDETTLTVSPSWLIVPELETIFTIAESTWKFAGQSQTDRIVFTVPNRRDATIQISGRSANVRDEECSPELSPLSRWRIGGATGRAYDAEPSDEPGFGIFPAGDGTIELQSVSFPDLTHTRSVAGGTLTIHYWDELASPSSFSLLQEVTDAQNTLTLNLPGSGGQGSLIQIGSEIMGIEETVDEGAVYQVSRGIFQTPVQSHPENTSIFHLEKKVVVVPFVRDFFGSPSSGSFTYRLWMPNVRIAAAELYVTNSQGDSPVGARAYTLNTDGGIRTLSGGQVNLQLNGYLAIQSDAVPPFISSTSRVIRDIFALVREPATGGDIQMRILTDGVPYCDLIIQDGQIISEVESGFGKPPISEMSVISLDILSVPPSGVGTPGRDLTVTLRH